MVGINENKETKTNDTSRTDGKNRQEENRAQPSEQQWALWSPTNFMACLGGRQGEKGETYLCRSYYQRGNKHAVYLQNVKHFPSSYE